MKRWTGEPPLLLFLLLEAEATAHARAAREAEWEEQELLSELYRIRRTPQPKRSD